MKRGNSGFTLVELIVSIALLAIILVPATGMLTNSFKIQSKSSMKTSITRVGQYIIENFKNKNYLAGILENSNNEGEAFLDDFNGYISYVKLNDLKDDFSDDFKQIMSDIEEIPWEIEYKGVKYNADVDINGFKILDLENLDIPEKERCDGSIDLESNGTFSNASSGSIGAHPKGSIFTDPINGEEYEADYPTIILTSAFFDQESEKATLWINNKGYCEKNSDDSFKNQKQIRIIKKFEEDLYVYIEGTKLSIIRGKEGDGATSGQTMIITSYVGKDPKDGKKNFSEIILDATMTISKYEDESISDSFDFSFPVNFDYKANEVISSVDDEL